MTIVVLSHTEYITLVDASIFCFVSRAEVTIYSLTDPYFIASHCVEDLGWPQGLANFDNRFLLDPSIQIKHFVHVLMRAED